MPRELSAGVFFYAGKINVYKILIHFFPELTKK